MQRIREPVVAGMFYPADPVELRQTVEGYLHDTHNENPPPKALIVPHAGYVYSGPVAASAYRLLAPLRERIRRVVLLGPSHRVGFQGLALSSAQSFATPLGTILVDHGMDEALLKLPAVAILDEAHSREHSLEVHLPFLQVLLSDFELIPMVVGDAAPQEVAQVLEMLWGKEETLIVISSDLSHYHDYATARQRDQATTSAIEALRYEDLGFDDACGRNPIRGLLYYSRRHGLHGTAIDVRNSGDTAGPKDRVVGYGAYVFQ
ncbi:MAG: AmmeMemoRadiSam system protein B [Gammaproteobacteria bacterium]|nr:AmmeMemoRadiSam system protein B [Gammaproteobacteria bacterium]